MTFPVIATRPLNAGSKGAPYTASTNCFRLDIVRPLAFFHYHGEVVTLLGQISYSKQLRHTHHPPRTAVVITTVREIRSVRRRKEIVQRLYTQVAPDIFQPGQVVFDGKAGLFASKDLDFADRTFEVSLENNAPFSGSAPRLALVKLTHVGEVRSRGFELLLESQGQSDNALSFLRILNLLLHNATDADFRKVATKNTLFADTKVINLRSGFELWRGCFASVRPSFDHALLNLDVSSAIMYERGDLIAVSMHLLGCRDPRELEDPGAITRLKAFLKKLRVKQVHAGKIGRIRSIRELTPRAGWHTFISQDGEETTVKQYFLTKYNYRLNLPDLPGILVIKHGRDGRPDETDVVPFELLEVIEGQIYRRRLDTALQAHVQKLTTTTPEARKKVIMDCLRAFNPAALGSAGLHVGQKPLTVAGRVLPPPQIYFGHGQFLKPDQGAWKISKRSARPLFKPCVIGELAVLCYDNRLGPDPCQAFVNKLLICMGSLGIQVDHLRSALHDGRIVLRSENAQGNVLKHLKDIVAGVKRASQNPKFSPDDTFLLLVILPQSGSVMHRQIKEIGDTTHGPGLITQCMVSDKLERLSDPYLYNLLLKINAKLGGINFVPIGAGMEWIHGSKEPTMVVGMDVSHPHPGIMRPSVAGFVSSVDRNASKYVASCSMQEPRLETIQDLREMFSKALKQFCKYSNMRVLPFRILVYRDGVSEGEYLQVASSEFEAIKDAIAKVWKGAPESVSKPPIEDVKVTFVVVGKRHHVRFFPRTKEEGDRSGNCPSGFVADTKEILNPNVYDFYLQSHAGLLGTSRPAHYIVIKDENKFDSDGLQALSFGLCHTYARATRAVSIPAPVYYADLVCRRADIHLRYKGDESGPSATGSELSEYNPEDWEFNAVQTMQERLMYFI
ncbi:hypothetical protein M0805_004569 [Coniferiporia weirii]|nr:hypothetical protein M0805_004569 [Coniferiporia weirii]